MGKEVPIIIAADNEEYLLKTVGVNIGLETAQRIAKDVNGTVIIPQFPDNEKGMRGMTTFNDMAFKSSRVGVEAIKQQLTEVKQSLVSEKNQTKQQDKSLETEKPKSRSRAA